MGMEIEKQRLFTQQLDDAPKPNANLQTIFDDTCINPEYNVMKTVATRSVGSRQRFRALPQDEKQQHIKMFSPAVQPIPGGLNLQSQMAKQNPNQKDDKNMKPKDPEQNENEERYMSQRKRSFEPSNHESSHAKGSKPTPLHLDEDIELTPIIEEDVKMIEADENPTTQKLE